MKTLRLITLALGLTLVLPAPQVKAAGPAENTNFGWIMAGAALAGVIWWNVWGKSWVKGYKPKAKEDRRCTMCFTDFKKDELITLHSNDAEYVNTHLPNVDSLYKHLRDQNHQMRKALRKDLPTMSHHKACPQCVVRFFADLAERGTCKFHNVNPAQWAGRSQTDIDNGVRGHGTCLNCTAKGACIQCPRLLNDEAGAHSPRCEIGLDILWIRDHNPNFVQALYKTLPHHEAVGYTNLWNALCAELPGTITQIKGTAPYSNHGAGVWQNWTTKWKQSYPGLV